MKASLLFAFVLASSLMIASPQQATGQYVYGLSAVGYAQDTREIFGESATWVDYYVAYYYDPEVLGELYWQFSNEDPLDSGYARGFSAPEYGILIPAIVYTYSRSYLPATTYTTYSTHFVRSYYYYSYCSGFFSGCYADPYGFSRFNGGIFGGNYGWPGFAYDPYFRASGRRYTLGTTQVSITTPLDCGAAASGGSSTESTNGPCPTPTPTPTPTPPVVTVEVNPSPLLPSGVPGGTNTATVTVRTFPAVANRAVVLTRQGLANSGGHIDGHHTGARPTGSLRRAQGMTDASGEFQTTYTPSHISGIVTIEAAVAGARGSDTFTVQVPGLQELLPGNNYVLIGFANTPEHPEGTNHWGAAAANNGLRQIADDYKAEFYGQNPIPENRKLHYNDQSLPLGGKFDLAHRWSNAGPHREHRVGINCDVRCCADPGFVPHTPPDDRWARLNQLFFNRGSTRTRDETNTADPHWHLRFEFGQQQAAIDRNAGNFVNEVFWAVLDRQALDSEWQERMDVLENAQSQGQALTIDAAKGIMCALFNSIEYGLRNRSDEDFITDLYEGFLLREPDQGGYDFWLFRLRDDNSQGLNGRERIARAFAESQEFADLISGFVDTPPPAPTCDPSQEQTCYDQGGTWDPDTCSCTYDPDPCGNKPSLCY